MAWTATLKGLERKDDAVEVLVVLTDGTDIRSYRYSTQAQGATVGWLRAAVLQTVAGLTVVSRDLIVGMDINTTPDVPIDPPPPTKDEQDRHAFVAAYQALRGIARGVESGLLRADDPFVTDAQAAAQALFKPEYVNEL